MIFAADMVGEIRAGRKTATRRKVRGPLRCPSCTKTGTGPICLDCAVLTKPLEACRYREGKDYAVQPGRGETATCRIYVTSVHAEPVGAITHDDAQAEGFPRGVIDFAGKWLELHDRNWPAEGQTVTEQAVLDRFHAKHTRTMVWVIAFRLAIPDTPRLLATTATWDPAKQKKDQAARERNQEIETTDADRGYTATAARALPHEPEAVDAETQAWITSGAGLEHSQWQAREQARRAQDREKLSLGVRLDLAVREAQAAGYSSSRELRVIEKRLKELENAGRAIRLRAA